MLDGRNNVVALFISATTLVDQYAYDAWGRPDLSTPGATQESIHQPLRYGGYWYDGWDDALGTWNSLSAALPWYWVGAREYDPNLERYLQPDPASAGGLPDYVYADDDPLDETDPSGLAGVPLGCASSTSLVEATQAAGCARAGAQAQRDAQTSAVLWALPNFFVLNPLRATFGANSSPLDRLFTAARLLPVVGWVGHGLSMHADIASTPKPCGRGITRCGPPYPVPPRTPRITNPCSHRPTPYAPRARLALPRMYPVSTPHDSDTG